MRNIEYKAELRDASLARFICRRLGGTLSGTLHQTDTYYNVPFGRLKKRETEGAPTEVIEYFRAMRESSRTSTYTIWTLDQFHERYGRQALPVWTVVRKSRELYLVDDTRIHLDAVDGLGEFVELETVLKARRSLRAGRMEHRRIREALRPAMGEAISLGYADLLASESAA